MYSKKVHKAEVYKFTKILETTSQFWVPECWHKDSSILRIHKHKIRHYHTKCSCHKTWHLEFVHPWYRGHRSVPPLDFGTRWTRVLSFVLRPHCHRAKNPLYLLNRWLDGVPAGNQTPDYLAHCQVTILTELSWPILAATRANKEHLLLAEGSVCQEPCKE